MTILDKIIAKKHKEVAILKSQFTHRDWEKMTYFKQEVFSLRNALQNSEKGGIIAEFKRKSPSKGLINEQAEVLNTTVAYQKAGACAVSILTDEDFFGGKIQDIQRVRESLTIPILRKEFIVDEFQLLQAKAIGADAILLIAECHEIKRINKLCDFAKSIGLEVLTELHETKMLEHIPANTDIVGVNNRNLKNFEVNIQTSIDLYDKLPQKPIKISESGLQDFSDLKKLQTIGYQGFLIGENFMKTADPGKSCSNFIQELNV